MRVLFTSLRVPSHFLPLVPFIEACRRAGHEVAVAAPREIGERASASGATFFELAHPGDVGLEPLWKRMRDATGEEAKLISIGELFVTALAGTALANLQKITAEWRPQIVVRESQEYAAVVAAEQANVPHVHVAITARSNESELVPFAAPALDELGRSAGLSPDPSGERLLAEAALTLFPAALEDPERAPAPVSRFRSPRQPAAPLPTWWASEQEPFVYATLGTVAGGMEQMRSAYRVLLAAVAPLPIRVLLTIGGDLSMELLGDVPANVHVERFVPQDEILPHARAVLCHGGSGTVIGTLAAGVPMVVAPMFADQKNNAVRVAAIGAGVALPPRNESAQDLRSALSDVLARESFREAAGRVAREIAALPSIDEAPLEIERLARR